MTHWIALPVVVPLMCGALLILLGGRAPRLSAHIGVVVTAGLMLVAAGLLMQADSGIVQAYLLGNWKAPYGIVLVLDRLSALMLLLTAGVALAALLYARGGDDRRGPHFHALFQFQLMGLNGAFLTGDLFNLFVFFEVLLISSYGLLLHGAGTARLKASLHYVGFNLAGAALFLIAVSLLYGLTGTLNMADMAQRMAHLPADRTLLVQSAALLLLVVFFVKAALLPLYFWLPATYAAACAPASALFAVMTKVGIYAVLRVTTLIFGEAGGPTAGLAGPWLPVLALATIVVAAIGTLAATQLRLQIGYLVVGSAGTLLLAVGLAQPGSVAAGLFYMVNSTLVVAALFLLADRIGFARTTLGDLLRPAAFDGSRNLLGVLFLVCAVAVAGLPPLAGFMGKAMLLQAAGPTAWGAWVVAVVLGSSLLLMVALARSGSVLFWSPAPAAQGAAALATGSASDALPTATSHRWALGMLLAAVLACSAAAGPLSRHCTATATQLFERRSYLRAVFDAQPAPAALDVRREMREREAQP